MAFENYQGTSPITFPTTSTGLARWRGCTLNASGNAIYPAGSTGGVIGVITVGTTGSTVARAVTVQTMGVAKVAAAGSTVSAGDVVAFDSSGRVAAFSAGDVVAGRVMSGSSGSTGRILSVQLATPSGGSTQAF